jgi:hypothetical protein
MSESKEGKEVFICVIRDSEVYNGLEQEATFSSCKKFLNEFLCGKRKSINMYFAKGKVIKIWRPKTITNDTEYEVLITKLYLKDKTDITLEGRCATYSQLWIKLGEYAREQFMNDNPSRRKFIKGLE